jgi:hypothetical protein
MALRYRPYMPRRAVQQGSDVERGLNIGSQIGKGLSGLGEAIQKAQAQAKQDAIANELMNQGPTGQDPTMQNLGKLGGGDGSSQDLGILPADQTFSNPATGNIEPLQTGDDNAPIQMPASTGSGPTVGSQMNQPPTATSSDDNWNLAADTSNTALPGESSALGPTVGSLIHSGGLQELKLRQAFQEQNLSSAIKQAQLAKEGPNSLSVALDRARLAQIQAQTAGTGGYARTKKAEVQPAVNIGIEPVTDQDQLTTYIDKIYGKGASADMASTMNEEQTIEDPKNPGQMIPNPNRPVISGNSVTVGPVKNRITLPLAQAQQFVKQQNALLLKQGLPAYRVPGEDQTLGTTVDNPYIAKNNLDVFSRAPGTVEKPAYITLPNGKTIAYVRLPDGRTATIAGGVIHPTK